MAATDTEATRTHAATVPVVVEGDSPAGIAYRLTLVTSRAFVEGLDPAAAAGTAETLAPVVSELSTDALRHGGGRYTLELTFTAEAVNAAVSDLNPAPSRERAPDLDGGAGGFGWPMVRRLTSKVTIAPRPWPGQGPPRPPPTATQAQGNSHPAELLRQPGEGPHLRGQYSRMTAG
ncbi:ATP-binding protein [Streptomyces sp. NPDC001817]|uniref:ATP-binding protein n=1 Tax=Streptomyces sp. NPDC001817 TaxID=3154398 RepID=UPI00331C7103